MVVGMDTVARELQYRQVPSRIEVTLVGKASDCNEKQFANVDIPSEVTEVGILTETRLSQPKNENSPILVTELEIPTVVRRHWPQILALKAPSPIDVTVEAIVISVEDPQELQSWQSANA